MPQEQWPAELATRRDALRQAAAAPGADLGTLLEAALTELDAAIESAADFPDVLDGPGNSPGDALHAERRLLRAAFQNAPVPLFLLERDGTVRRANDLASELTGASPGYATGKPFTALVDLPSRAAVQTQLAAAVRTGKPRQVAAKLLTPAGPEDGMLSIQVITLPGDPRLLIVSAATGKTLVARGHKPARPRRMAGPVPGIQSMTRRMDMVTAVTRLLLDNSTFSEAVTLQRCARLLAGELASWVIVDMDRGGRLRRQFAIGPRDGASESIARTVRATDPETSTVCWQVHMSGKAALMAHAEDVSLLGVDEDGKSLLMMLGATSLICVAISDGTNNYGTLTLARRATEESFAMTDLALAEELGEHLAISIRVDRMFRRRSEVAQALQASLLPSRLPETPGLDLAAVYIPATEWQEISGDFYDVFPVRDDGWGIVVGDVSGKGEEAAAMTAAARHSARTVAFTGTEPAEVLRGVNDVLLAGDYEDRFVTAALAYLRLEDGMLRVRISHSGHPGPAVVRADGRVEVLEGDGLPLGLFPGIEPETMDLSLAPGDMLFFYTDGVTEARAADLSYFEDRLADKLAAVAGQTAGETVRAVQELVTEFSGGELRDDMTMLAVKVAIP
jgi:serine phosphatase RsbU (regulator of sigma subunit)/PAS domain-containing protein